MCASVKAKTTLPKVKTSAKSVQTSAEVCRRVNVNEFFRSFIHNLSYSEMQLLECRRCNIHPESFYLTFGVHIPKRAFLSWHLINYFLLLCTVCAYSERCACFLLNIRYLCRIKKFIRRPLHNTALATLFSTFGLGHLHE